MLPALNHHADLANLQAHDYNKLKDQLEFAERDIEEEKRERARMKEQLAIQNDIINRLYTRLNQIEEQHADESKIVGRLLEDAVSNQRMINESRRQNRMEKNTVDELQTTKDKFQTFSNSIREETTVLHQLTAKLKDDITNAQEYINTLYHSDQNNTGRVSKLESNTNVAMECIKSLQNVGKTLENKIKRLADDTSAQESEITSSLQQLGDCLNQAKEERSALEEKLNNNAHSFKSMLAEMKYELQQKEQVKEKVNLGKETALIQSLEDISRSVKTVEAKIIDDMSMTLQESKSLIGSVQGNVLKERSARLETEQILRRETANVINNLREHLSEQLGHSINAYRKDREKIQKNIKQLNESISIIEKSNEATKFGLEHIIQAEIKSRLSQVKTIESAVKTTQAALGAVDDRREQDISKLKGELEGGMQREFESTQKHVALVQEGLGDVKLIVTSLQEEAALAGDHILECKGELEALIKGTEEAILSQVRQQLDSVWAQVGDAAKASAKQATQIRGETTALADKLQKETDARTADLLETGRHLDTKVDKVSHQGHLNSLNKAIFENTEKMTNLEVVVESQNEVVKSDLSHLQEEVYTINKLFESLKEHEIEHIKRDIRDLRGSGIAGPPAGTEPPATPELTLTNSDTKLPTQPPTPEQQPHTPVHTPPPTTPAPSSPPAPPSPPPGISTPNNPHLPARDGTQNPSPANSPSQNPSPANSPSQNPSPANSHSRNITPLPKTIEEDDY